MPPERRNDGGDPYCDTDKNQPRDRDEFDELLEDIETLEVEDKTWKAAVREFVDVIREKRKREQK